MSNWVVRSFLVAAILPSSFAVLVMGQASQNGRRLYALAATPTENISYGTNRYPATLYRVNAVEKLEVVREIVSQDDGSAAVQAAGNVIFVVDQPKFTVNVIHSDDPTTSDSVAFNIDHRGSNLDLQGGLVPAIVQKSVPDVLLPVVVPASNSPSTVTWLSVSSGKNGLGPRVQADKWEEYAALEWEGTPGMPILSLPFGVQVEDGHLVRRSGNNPPHLVDIDTAPPASPVGAKGLLLAAANEQYLVLKLPGNLRSQVLVHDRARDSWKNVDVEGDESRLRLFGLWLATDVEMQSSGPFSGDKPEKSGERDSRTNSLPNVYGEYGAYCWLNHRRFPGILVLQNLADGRKIRIETHQEDSEILSVDADKVLYRVNDSIYQATVADDKIQGAALLVKDDDVPEVHWVFWSD